MKMSFDTGCTVCVMGYSLGHRRLFASHYTIEITITPKNNQKDCDDWWIWLYDIFKDITSTLEDTIFIGKKCSNFDIVHYEDVKNPTIQVVYEDGFTFTLPEDWIVESRTSLATHIDVANWIKEAIEKYIDFHHTTKDNQLPDDCDVTIVVWDAGEYAHTTIEFNLQQPTDKET